MLRIRISARIGRGSKFGGRIYEPLHSLRQPAFAPDLQVGAHAIHVGRAIRFSTRRFSKRCPQDAGVQGTIPLGAGAGFARERAQTSSINGHRRIFGGDASVLTHSFASRFCDVERFFGSAVLCEDGFGAGGPLEGLWVLVSMLDPLVNRGLSMTSLKVPRRMRWRVISAKSR